MLSKKSKFLIELAVKLSLDNMLLIKFPVTNGLLAIAFSLKCRDAIFVPRKKVVGS